MTAMRGDLVAAARSLAELLSSPIGAVIAGANALTVDDPDLAATRDRYWASRFAFADALVRRAVERGELPPGVQPRPAMDMPAGALHMRAMLTHEPLEPDLPECLADVVLFGLHGPAAP